MLREYEFTFVTRGDLPDAEKAKVVDGYEQILLRSGGAVLKKSDWGAKRLAYPIKKVFKGHYTHYDIATTPDDIAECERLIRIDDNILRHLVVKTRDQVDVEKRKAELAKDSATKQQQLER